MIQIENLSVSYQQTLALEDISLTIQGPTILGILGPNGAGKSTLLKAMLGLLPHSGSVQLDQVALTQSLQRVAYVEQKTAIDFHFPINVRECVSLGLYPQQSIFKRKTKADLQKVEDAMELVNVTDLADRQIGQLSGGQFQRVLIARCLVQEADVIFLDEPFAGIDSISEDIIMQTLQTLKKEGKTILIVHHDLSKVPAYFDHILLLHRKLIAYGKTEETFTEDNLQAAYGHELFIGGGIR
ncbi:metal ABC transporter ATP-binding protein [Streptococcus sp. DD13]|uniref:metal ABC transporter ATP-binding protein n=1 Tax=Streptococcus sp. DD13 TaxID=1777881 RepID=UPI0007967C07|nr:metal ABC transporter ATP-binding protein [Streptococcus sp. DD13]KXT77868.1 Manganese ABC transporter, ATP-binding protein SitB [Streptococcus sp. DD13]